MAEPEIRVGVADDPDRYLATDLLVWSSEPSSLPAEQDLAGLPADQRFAAELDGADPATYPGIYGVYPLTLSAPGSGETARPLACAGLTWVGVHPDHRRRGVLTAMMRHHLERVHAQPGTHLAALHASEPAIYGRYGYGMASLEHTVTLGRGTAFTAPGLDPAPGQAPVTTELLSTADPRAADRMYTCARRCAGSEVGAVVGEPSFYRRWCQQRPEDLRGKEPLLLLFARRNGEDIGMAVLRRQPRWERGQPAGEVSVSDLWGGPEARLALVRRLVDFDLMSTVRIDRVGQEDPVLHWLGAPRAASDLATYDGLWLRVVDLPEALSARWYAAPCDVVVEVTDDLAPWNAGRWRIAVGGDGSASVTRTDADADVALPVAALGAAYLGAGNLLGRLAAGLLEERRAGAVRELWRALRTDLPPSPAMGF